MPGNEEHAKFAQFSRGFSGHWEQLPVTRCRVIGGHGMTLDDLLGWNFEGEVKYTGDTDLEPG